MLEKYRQELFDCSRCGFCRVWGWSGVENVCPTYPFTAGWETHYARGRVRLAQATLDGEVEITEHLLEHAYVCTLCSSCEAHCPVDLPLTEIFHAWRQDLAEAGHTLPEHERMINLMKRYLNPYGPKMDEPEVEEPQPARVLYYPGCTTTRMAPEIVEAVTSSLGKLGIDFALFQEDTCCSIPLYEIGQMSEAGEIARQTLELIDAYEPEVLLTTCPACYRAFRSIYPEELGLTVDCDVQHITEFLLPRVPDRVIEVVKKVTWHDPCILGRHLDMYEEPRELLKAIPGLELVEMHSNRENALCCGAGGGVYFAAQRTARDAVGARLEQAEATGAEEIVTSCPNCHVRFRQGTRIQRMELRAKSIAEIIDEALEAKRDPEDEER
jgi:Fe-S oxidoreductase